MIVGQGTTGQSLVGTPMVTTTGLVVAALVFLPVTSTWVGSLVTVAHESGHMALAILAGRGLKGFQVNETKGGGATDLTDGSWGAGLILIFLVGYLTPPILGLAGVALILAGKSWSLLWAALVLLLGAWAQAKGLFTGLIVLLAGAGIGWVALRGTTMTQEVLALSLVWLMLIGGVASLFGQGLGSKGSDAAQLAAVTWIPAVVWVALFWFVALVCLWLGARRLLGW